MDLFFDEDIGTGVPNALRTVGVRGIHFLRRAFREEYRRQGSVSDRVWLPVAGARGWLVVSCDRSILDNPDERQLVIDHGVGAVFLSTGQLSGFQLLRLILNQWEWLLDIDASVARPFAFVLAPDGRAERDGRV